jgi:hypothetical protein
MVERYDAATTITKARLPLVIMPGFFIAPSL